VNGRAFPQDNRTAAFPKPQHIRQLSFRHSPFAPPRVETTRAPDPMNMTGGTLLNLNYWLLPPVE